MTSRNDGRKIRDGSQRRQQQMEQDMPIKPENSVRYPKDWKAIRAEVMARAGNRCEGSPAWPECRRPHHGFLNKSTGEVTRNPMQAESWQFADRDRVTLIVLTIAHKDHVPENVGTPGNRPNLAAWCQRCHLAYDQEHHQRNARATRRANKKTVEMFPLTQPKPIGGSK